MFWRKKHFLNKLLHNFGENKLGKKNLSIRMFKPYFIQKGFEEAKFEY